MIFVAKDKNKVPHSLCSSSPKIGADVRERLEADFNRKCCYCEDGFIKGEVEHFLPKSKFPHLEFDWENLLWACHRCNIMKLAKVNSIANPIVETDLIPPFEFDIDGGIAGSLNPKATITVETCGLNRPDLKDKRKAVTDEFIKNLEFIAAFGNKAMVINYINDIFITPISTNKELSFVLLRRHFIENQLVEILRKI